MTTIVVGYAAGGVMDAMARNLAPPLRDALAMPVIVDNRSGAGGRIAVGAVVAAPPTGRVLLLTPGAMITLQPHLYRDLGYNPVTQLVPVAQVASSDLAIVVAAGNAATDIDSLVRAFRRDPASASCGAAGAGTVAHFALLELARKTGVELTIVQYRSALQVVEALLEGTVAGAAIVPSIAAPYVAAGKLRALATTGAVRAPLLPGIPTLREAGVDVLAREWAGMFAPAGTTRETVEHLATATETALKRLAPSPEAARYGIEPGGAVTTRFAALIDTEYRRWGEIVKTSGVKAET